MSCEYCKNKASNKKIVDSIDNNEGVYVRIYRDKHGAYLGVHGWYDRVIAIEPKTRRIKYCPMCGEELR